MRKKIIAGNWKMNILPSESKEIIDKLLEEKINELVEVVICPPSTHLSLLKDALGNSSNIKLGAQNMHFEDKGAFTGEVSPLMLKDLGVSYVIIGHSERRQYFKEDDEMVNLKVKAALKNDLIPIMCCGETLEQRENNVTEALLEQQIMDGLAELEDITKVVIAYEPIWAIGTGKTATSKEANDTISYIRMLVAKMYGQDAADKVRILYGGSVKPDTIDEQMSMSDIDGALVGGASLKPLDFLRIINFNN